jgi:hypothetical protein
MPKSTAKLRLINTKPPKVGESLAAPQNLSKDAQLWFEQTRDGYGISDSAGLRTLEIAAEALDEMTRVKAVIKKAGGDYYKDRNGVLRQHPASRHFDQARRGYLAALKQLKLKT